MPRHVRNWWVEVRTDDGRIVSAGPVRRDGGITVRVYQRDRGAVIKSFSLDGIATSSGKLRLEVLGPDGSTVAEHVTER